MPKNAVTIEDDVRAVLERCTFGHGMLQLPDQLDRKLYEKVNKAIVAAGGKWDRRAKAHTFVGGKDPKEIFGLALEQGHVVDEKKAMQQFFTPGHLAADIASMLRVRPGFQALEPSAGDGAIAQELRAAGADVTCIELDQHYRDVLREKGFNVMHGNFLNYPQVPSYDVIGMNPPFTGGQDVEHVTHAYGFLKPGGKLVAVMSGAVEFNASNKFNAFRELLSSINGVIHGPLPPGTFAQSGTNVRTVLVSMRRK